MDWIRLERVFEEVSAATPSERSARLETLRSEDPELARELELLLRDQANSSQYFSDLGSRIADEAAVDRKPPELLGRRIGHYDIVDLLGKGGMGVVYRAHDTVLDRMVAIKVLSDLVTLSPRARERFLTEARSASALRHPGICTVHHVGESDEGVPYMVMTLYEGQTLDVSEAWSPSDAAGVVAELADALSEAHSRGITHRDVKPGNVLMIAGNKPVLLDFGIAGNEAARLDSGRIEGTLTYMSPEQLSGRRIDARSDIWSVGVLLYQMLCGRAPFVRERKDEHIQAIIYEPPPPLPDSIPEGLRTIVGRCVSKNPSKRYQTSSDLVRDLRQFLRGRPIATLRRLRRRGRIAWALVLVLGVVITGALIRTAVRWMDDAAAKTVLITPFVDNTPGGGNEAVAWGLSNDLALLLGPVESVVVKRLSTTVVDYGEAGRRFGARFVLTGTIQEERGVLRVIADLIDTNTSEQVLSFSTNRSPDHPLRLQQSVALAIVDSLRFELAIDERQRLVRTPTFSSIAAEALAEGRFRMNRRTPQDIQAALPYLQSAVRADSGYADAWAELAQAVALLGGAGYTLERGPQMFEQAQSLTNQALSLDEASSVAHMTQGYLQHEWQWDWLGSELSFGRAVDLNPDNAIAHHLYATHLSELGETRRARREIDRAEQLDPGSSIIAANKGLILFYARDYRASIQHLSDLIDRDDSFYIAYVNRSLPLAMLGRHEEARRDLETAARLVPNAPIVRALMVANARMAGAPDADAMLRSLLSDMEAGEIYISPALMANIYLAGDDHAAALDWLAQGLEDRDVYTTVLRVWPFADPLHDEPRFKEIIAAMNLPSTRS